jgi:hypothetical protein
MAMPRSGGRRRQARATMERTCLRCGRRFGSEGAHNRLCDQCRAFLDTNTVEPRRGRLARPRPGHDDPP